MCFLKKLGNVFDTVLETLYSSNIVVMNVLVIWFCHACISATEKEYLHFGWTGPVLRIACETLMATVSIATILYLIALLYVPIRRKYEKKVNGGRN